MTINVHDIPHGHEAKISFPDEAAGNATNRIAVWVAPFNCYIDEVGVEYTDGITGQATNNFTIRVLDIDGTTVLGTARTYGAGTNETAGSYRQLYNPAQNSKQLNAGQPLYLERVLNGLGLDMPRGNMVVRYSAR